jgi:hypothetical protein
LFTVLENLHLGCYLNNCYSGILGYADDLALIAPSKYVLEKMIEICENFAVEHDLLFNPGKSTYIVFSNRLEMQNINFGNRVITSVKTVKYLGNILEAPRCTVNHNVVLSDYSVKVNAVCNTFRYLPFDIKYKLVKSIATSMYGCELWHANTKCIKRIDIVWRKSIRKILNISSRTHCKFIPYLVNNNGLLELVISRKINFLRKCLQSQNCTVVLSANLVQSGSLSTFTESILKICSLYNMSFSSITSVSKEKLLLYIRNLIMNSVTAAVDTSVINFILDTLYARDYGSEILKKSEMQIILDHLCTT